MSCEKAHENHIPFSHCECKKTKILISTLFQNMCKVEIRLFCIFIVNIYKYH